MENRSTFYKMKVVKDILVPNEWRITNDYDSHRPLLYLVVSKTTDDIIEFGCGHGSTMLLRSYCFLSKIQRRFSSFETNKEWANKIEPAYYCHEPYLKISSSYNPCVLFIDSAPGEERKYLIAKHSWSADVIVVHDTELSADYVYGMKEILSTFKYRLDFRPEGLPHTSAVSNFINIQDWI